MKNLIHETRLYYDGAAASEGEKVNWVDHQSYIGIIEHLKEEFGDYADPLAYSWIRHTIKD